MTQEAQQLQLARQTKFGFYEGIVLTATDTERITIEGLIIHLTDLVFRRWRGIRGNF